MAVLMGLLGIQDRNTTVDQIGQQSVFDAINQVAASQSQEVEAMTRIFVQSQTTLYKEVYHLPGGGRMQDADEKGAQPGAVKSGGQWDVAYDLRDARDAMGWDDVAVAYMTVGELDAHMETIAMRHTNWVRYHVMRHLLNKDNETFRDKIRGTLTIKRLANGDADSYPALIGGDDDITAHNHYIGTAYNAAAISAVNNPVPVVREHLEEHFDTGNPVLLVNPAQIGALRAIPGFVARTPEHVSPGDDTAELLADAEFAGVPGKLQGTMDDVAIFSWRRMPAGYAFGMDLEAPAPLKERVDEDIAASLRGFKLVAEQTDFPLTKSQWRDRRGYGVANRLNGVSIQFSGNSTYANPAGLT